jgi:hypothetical protein
MIVIFRVTLKGREYISWISGGREKSFMIEDEMMKEDGLLKALVIHLPFLPPQY